MEKWLVQAKKADFDGISKMFGISPVVARIIRNRDIISAVQFNEYLNGSVKNMNSPYLMKDMDKAVEMINNAISTNMFVRVIGDYDIDGICSGYILTDALIQLGANVDFDVPERLIDGYGLNERLIKKAFDDGVDLIITCDNGIAATMQIEYAKTLGMKVIVTDHHEVPYTLMNGEKKYVIPPADAVIDQKQQDCNYPFKDLCGAGVVLKLIQALINNKDDHNLQIDKYFVFAAIATVGDIVDLVGENRIIVKYGLSKIKEIDNAGLKALIEENGLTDKNICSYHIGFILGPCINAGGRLDTAKKAFSLFSENDREAALRKAVELTELNKTRKAMTSDFEEKAIQIIENDKMYDKQKVIVLYLKDCHESLAGIIAGRIKEKFNKPTFVLTDCEDGVKGSGRSIEAYSMFEELVLADTIGSIKDSDGKIQANNHLIKKYGGHKMAAGLSLDYDKVDKFREVINENCKITDNMMVRKIWIDVPLPFEYLDINLVNQLEILEPFGKANEKPVFAEKCERINSIKVRGKNKNVILLNITNKSGKSMNAVLFEKEDIFIGNLSKKYSMDQITSAMNGRQNNLRMSIIYYPQIDDFYGNNDIRVVIKRYSC